MSPNLIVSSSFYTAIGLGIVFLTGFPLVGVGLILLGLISSFGYYTSKPDLFFVGLFIAYSFVAGGLTVESISTAYFMSLLLYVSVFGAAMHLSKEIEIRAALFVTPIFFSLLLSANPILSSIFLLSTTILYFRVKERPNFYVYHILNSFGFITFIL